MKQRIDWIDVLKCFGIFAIYWGHYGVKDGYACHFVFQYHVPLFFLISGCAEYVGRDSGILNSLKKVFRGLLIPWIFFCVATLVVHVLDTECELLSLWAMIWKIVLGTPRNNFEHWGMWFLTCMAVIKILFTFLKRVKSKCLILLICAVIHVITWRFVDTSHPALPFNADLALYYLLYYAIGYVSVSGINSILHSDKMWVKLITGLSFCISGGYCAYLYFGRNLFSGLTSLGFAGEKLLPIVTALTAIWFQILLAYVFRDVACFCTIGRNTLYLCGSEYPVRIILVAVFGVLGFQATPPTSLVSFLYTVLTLWWANRWLVPIEKRIVAELYRVWDFLVTAFGKSAVPQESQ